MGRVSWILTVLSVGTMLYAVGEWYVMQNEALMAGVIACFLLGLSIRLRA